MFDLKLQLARMYFSLDAKYFLSTAARYRRAKAQLLDSVRLEVSEWSTGLVLGGRPVSYASET